MQAIIQLNICQCQGQLWKNAFLFIQVTSKNKNWTRKNCYSQMTNTKVKWQMNKPATVLLVTKLTTKRVNSFINIDHKLCRQLSILTFANVMVNYGKMHFYLSKSLPKIKIEPEKITLPRWQIQRLNYIWINLQQCSGSPN